MIIERQQELGKKNIVFKTFLCLHLLLNAGYLQVLYSLAAHLPPSMLAFSLFYAGC